MARYGSFLYRRNGRYYARIRVPIGLRHVYDKTHLRTSLSTADYDQAKLRVLETVLAWKRGFLELQRNVDAQQVVAGSALLLGDGLITIESAARETGLTVEEVVREAINRRLELRVVAGGWVGTEMPAGELEFDDDGSFIVDSAAGFPQGFIAGELFVWRKGFEAASGVIDACLFFRDPGRKQAVVLPFPGVCVPAGALLMLKRDAESIRAELASGVTPAMLEASRRPLATAAPLPAQPIHKHAGMRVSK